MKQRELIHPQLHSMSTEDIQQSAYNMLTELLERCTISLVWQHTKITRTTLYKWTDESLPVDAMNVRDCAWFILVCETRPQIKMLLDHAPLQYKRGGKQIIATGEKNATPS